MTSGNGKLPSGMVFRHTKTSHSPGMLADLHCHNLYELIYVVSGNLAHVIEGRKYLLKSGDLVLIRPSRYHYLQVLTEEPYERYNLLFDPAVHDLECALQLPESLEAISLLDNSIAAGLFPKLDLYHSNLEQADFDCIMGHLLYELFLNLKVFSSPAPRQEQTDISPLLTDALEYINNNLFSISGVDEVAQALFISPSHLFHLFRTSLHRTPKKYITDKRLLAAQRLIQAGSKPTSVYKDCGFQDYTTFYRSYSSFFGHSPSQDGKAAKAAYPKSPSLM